MTNIYINVAFGKLSLFIRNMGFEALRGIKRPRYVGPKLVFDSPNTVFVTILAREFVLRELSNLYRGVDLSDADLSVLK